MIPVEFFARFLECCKFKMALLPGIRSGFFWRAVAAELFGTLLYVYVVCGTVAATERPDSKARNGHWEYYNMVFFCRSVSAGLAMAALSWTMSTASGGHLNPAVTVGMLMSRKIGLPRAFFYIIAQSSGGIVGAGLLYGLLSESDLGSTHVSPKLSTVQAFALEFMATYIFVLAYFAAADKKAEVRYGPPGVAAGLAMVACGMFTGPLTGGSMNPARSFGPAVVEEFWEHHWVYWVGPILGGALAGFMYDIIFSSNASMQRTMAYLTVPHYDGDSFDNKESSSYQRVVMKKFTIQGDEYVAIKHPAPSGSEMCISPVMASTPLPCTLSMERTPKKPPHLREKEISKVKDKKKLKGPVEETLVEYERIATL